MGHVESNPLPEGTGDCVGGVNPAVGIQNILQTQIAVLDLFAIFATASVKTCSFVGCVRLRIASIKVISCWLIRTASAR